MISSPNLDENMFSQFVSSNGAVAIAFLQPCSFLTFSFSLSRAVQNSTPSPVKTEKKETECSPQRTPSSPTDEVSMERSRVETPRAFNSVNTR